MARFTFRYETILKHREKAEQLCQRGLAQILHERNALMQRLSAMQQTISQTKRDAASGLVGKVDLEQVAGIARYSARCTADGHGLVRRVAELETRVEQARNRLIEASRERQALALLRDKQEQAWQLEQRRMEAKQFDEHATQAYARRPQAEPSPCVPLRPRLHSSSSST